MDTSLKRQTESKCTTAFCQISWAHRQISHEELWH